MLKAVFAPEYCVDLKGHIFPTEKYRLIYRNLIRENIITEQEVIVPGEPDASLLRSIHEPNYIRDLETLNRVEYYSRKAEMPIDCDIVNAAKLYCWGTVTACRTALKSGACVNIGGGFHHAYPDHGEGFCLFNDVACGARAVLDDGAVERVIVVDVDVHQGNGTAYIFRNDNRVFTLSIHQEDLYPVPKEKSDLDIGLRSGAGDREYLEALRALEKVLDKFQPRLAVYVGGSDPFIKDRLGDLCLSVDGLEKRDRYVFSECRKRNIPVAITLAGGYAPDIAENVRIHTNTIKAAAEIYADF